MGAHKETLGFQAEVKQLLRLMIHSLYSNKEIFLRELVSNASDACDRLRFEAIARPELLEGRAEPAIRLAFDKDARTITVSDDGIGMGRQELIDNLGTEAGAGAGPLSAALPRSPRARRRPRRGAGALVAVERGVPLRALEVRGRLVPRRVLRGLRPVLRPGLRPGRMIESGHGHQDPL